MSASRNLACYHCNIIGINPAKDKASLEEIYSKVYYNFVKVVDAADNYNTVPAGISRWVSVCVDLALYPGLPMFFNVFA